MPPDHTIGISSISSSGRVPLSMSTLRKAWSARIRVKSLTPPLPSVLPTTAITPSAPKTPSSISSAMPDASTTLSSTTLRTSMAIRLLPCVSRSLHRTQPDMRICAAKDPFSVDVGSETRDERP